ncbi:hypothetical protein KJ909_02550 [Patescibacteria group bacterium]|nr:hypothetical protein [Patescibacteria group bacterium]
MTDLDRNTRTLIVCFAVALLALIPLRFVEVGQMMVQEQKQVLGERVVVEPRTDCLSVEEADVLVRGVTQSLVSGEYENEDVNRILKIVEEIEANICR